MPHSFHIPAVKASSEESTSREMLLIKIRRTRAHITGKIYPTSQYSLAEMIGTTRSRVSFFMNRFRKLGFIEYNGRIKVHNSLLDVVLHEKFTERHPGRAPASATARSRSKPARRA